MGASDSLDQRDAAHLLRRAGFGFTARERDLLAGRSRAQAVDALLDVKPKATSGPAARRSDGRSMRRLESWWIRRMMSPRYRLQEKMVLFWHDHFPSSFGVVHRVDALAEQDAMFRLCGLGSFRELLYRVTRDRAMLDYLDGLRSRVGEVNENYARELMELFTMGPWDEDGVPNYTQDDVVELARALTGLYWARGEKKPVVRLVPKYHDAGEKTLFPATAFAMTGALGLEDESGVEYPPETNVLDALFAHRDSQGRPMLARFLTRKLWAWFATPTLDDALLDELSEIFVSSGYDLASLVRAILTHDAFYTEEARSSTPKTPIEFVLQAVIGLGAKPNLREIWRPLAEMGMELLDPPGVEGWQHGMAWLATSRYLARLQFAQKLASGRSGKDIIRFKPKVAKDATPAALVDAALDQLSLEVSEATRQHLVDYVGGGEFGSADWYETQYRGLFALLLALPEFQVH